MRPTPNLAFSPIQCSFLWPRRKLHQRPQCYRPHASSTPNTALRGPIGSFTEGLCAIARRRPPTQYSASWPHTELHRRPPCYRPHAFPPTQCSASWPYGELRQRRYSHS
eukprot:6352897-Pyramimonas_sp.AAC.1